MAMSGRKPSTLLHQERRFTRPLCHGAWLEHRGCHGSSTISSLSTHLRLVPRVVSSSVVRVPNAKSDRGNNLRDVGFLRRQRRQPVCTKQVENLRKWGFEK